MDEDLTKCLMGDRSPSVEHLGDRSHLLSSCRFHDTDLGRNIYVC